MHRDANPQDRPQRDLAFYGRQISHGIAEADGRGSAIDHVTARRLALWLLPRSQGEPGFMRGLVGFAQTGSITNDLKQRLRRQARSAEHPNRPHAARLLQYTVARGTDLGPIGDDFAAVCDQIDRADAMLEELHDRVSNGDKIAEPSAAGTSEQQPIALARHDPQSQTVSLILDAATANAAIHAISVHAADREAHVREIQQYSQNLPEDSYGRQNRQTITVRETRITARLRAIERAYRVAFDPDATPATESSQMPSTADRAPDHELEME
jgi:hypothetical protein